LQCRLETKVCKRESSDRNEAIQSVPSMSLPACTQQAGTVFGGIYSICLSVCTKSPKLLIRNWCNLVGICPTVNARSGSKMVTFDLELESYFRTFSSQAIYSEWLNPPATSSSFWRYIFRISRSRSSFKIMELISRLQNSCSAKVCAPLWNSLIHSFHRHTQLILIMPSVWHNGSLGLEKGYAWEVPKYSKWPRLPSNTIKWQWVATSYHSQDQFDLLCTISTVHLKIQLHKISDISWSQVAAITTLTYRSHLASGFINA